MGFARGKGTCSHRTGCLLHARTAAIVSCAYLSPYVYFCTQLSNYVTNKRHTCARRYLLLYEVMHATNELDCRQCPPFAFGNREPYPFVFTRSQCKHKPWPLWSVARQPRETRRLCVWCNDPVVKRCNMFVNSRLAINRGFRGVKLKVL